MLARNRQKIAAKHPWRRNHRKCWRHHQPAASLAYEENDASAYHLSRKLAAAKHLKKIVAGRDDIGVRRKHKNKRKCASKREKQQNYGNK